MTTTFPTEHRTYADGVPHGTPEGYRQGCHGRGGCPGLVDFGVSCVDADMRYRGDYGYKRKVDAGLTPGEIVAAEVAVREAERARPRPVPRPPVVKVVRERKPRLVKAPRPVKVPRVTEPRVEAPPVHGTVDGYWRGGCYRDADCPASPTCAQVNLDRSLEKKPAAPRPPKVERKPREVGPPKHGTQWTFMRGCNTVEGCPNHALGLPSCLEVNREYHREYNRKRRELRGAGLRSGKLAHGTPSGYQLGCHDRETCPGNADGLSCADASLAAERDRRRRAGIAKADDLVSSAPVLEHIAKLRAAGLNPLAIALAAGVGRNTVTSLVYGRSGRKVRVSSTVRAGTAERILAVTA